MNTATVALGFDFGSRKLGVAAGQTRTHTATGLATVSLKRGAPDWPRIDALVREWNPDTLVVGLPKNRDDSDHSFTRRVRRFALQLERRYQVRVVFMDERLSSWEAGGSLSSRGRSNLDSLAAQLILQNWLDEQQRQTA